MKRSLGSNQNPFVLERAVRYSLVSFRGRNRRNNKFCDPANVWTAHIAQKGAVATITRLNLKNPRWGFLAPQVPLVRDTGPLFRRALEILVLARHQILTV